MNNTTQTPKHSHIVINPDPVVIAANGGVIPFKVAFAKTYPLPWHLVPSTKQIIASNGNPVVELERNADVEFRNDFIVTACNQHDQLTAEVATLREALNAFVMDANVDKCKSVNLNYVRELLSREVSNG